ncbi:MAG: NYN domain-containing protein, partial [Actinomycetes bacterium]
MSGSAPQRVVVFLDYQNVYHRARDAFCSPPASASQGQIDPPALGHLLAGRVPGGRLTGVRVYRGRPSQRRDARSYAAHRRQTDRQVSRGDRLVTVISRDLRYPPEWPRRAAQEKGIDVALAVDLVVMVANRACDVGILFSNDTDQAPAPEAVLAPRPQDPPACEVAAWAAPGVRPRSLSVRAARIRRHLLTAAEYRSVSLAASPPAASENERGRAVFPSDGGVDVDVRAQRRRPAGGGMVESG